MHGLKFKLEGADDCCRNTVIAYVTNRRTSSNDYDVELRCAQCRRYRGSLDDHAIRWLMKITSVFPEVKADVHVIRFALTQVEQ
jgi:hypothetical protein